MDAPRRRAPGARRRPRGWRAGAPRPESEERPQPVDARSITLRYAQEKGGARRELHLVHVLSHGDLDKAVQGRPRARFQAEARGEIQEGRPGRGDLLRQEAVAAGAAPVQLQRPGHAIARLVPEAGVQEAFVAELVLEVVLAALAPGRRQEPFEARRHDL